ncbi:MAG: T9SS type A sorting domain-containing protein [Candidatus Delongbacteria bacterium]|jgi:tetratricopeptide (TPR) repeat protein|nr:T9SS type A sorting domain-containing protein [Candidatus Delongbacteria bacterium]
MMKKMIAILLIALTMTLLSAEKYAVLIAGDYNPTDISASYEWQLNEDQSKPFTEFWNDTYLMWELLTQEKGYKPENVKVLFAKGQDLRFDPDHANIDIRYRAERHPGFTSITNFAATEANVQAVCADLESKMEYGEDFLFVWTMSHSTGSSIYLMNDALTGNVTVSYETFANYFKPLNALNKVYQLSMNYAKNLELQLQQENAVIISSSENKSYRADGKILNQPPLTWTIENEDIDDNRYYHGEVNFHLYSSSVGHRTDGELYYYEDQGHNEYDYFTDADVNFDSEISIREAFSWTEPRVSTLNEYPQLFDTPTGGDGLNRSDFISLKYPILLSNNVWGYCSGTSFPIRGNIGLADNIVYYPDYYPEFENFSDVTIFECGAVNPSMWGDFVFNNCDVKGEYEKFPVNLDGNFILKGARLNNLSLNFTTAGKIVPNYGTISDSDINLLVPENISFGINSRLTLRDCNFNGILNLPESSTLIVGGEVRITTGSEFYALANSTINFQSNGRLIIEDGAICDLRDMSVIMDPFGDIVIESGGTYTAVNVEFKPNLAIPDPDKEYEPWNGITAAPNSYIYLSTCSFTGAETAVSGTPAKLSVSNCTFTDCSNGINLTACNDFRIIRNIFTGKGEGTAITVTQSNGWINNNTASNFYKGLNVISCSPLMVQNTITNNVLNGVYTAGYNTYPQMYNPIQEASLKSLDEDLGIDDRELNNTVYNNGVNYVPPLGFISKASQLYMVSDSNIYLNEGMNNIYSDGNSVPCIMTLGLIPEGEIPRPILIYAPENYWGSNVNDSFFALSEPYYIDYSDYSTAPYGTEPLTSAGGSDENASKLLAKALEAELDGKYDKAIKTYEKIIEKYPDSSEALVAYAKLPDSYTQESLSIEPLIEMYDMNIAEENSNKKFFKELKVSSHIKAKNYDTAIALSEEMKLEAGTEGEIILCDIDIAIANMLKNAENKGKGRNESTNTDISALLDKLTGGEDKGDPADITDAVMPETSRLYQNYPNPFNPVTTIKFDLAKTGIVKLSVYNINGQKVAELLNGVHNAGIHTIEFDGSMLNTGVYYYTLETGRNRLTNKMILTKGLMDKIGC